MTEAVVTTEAGINTEQALIKSDLGREKFTKEWNACINLAQFCALWRISPKQASLKACKLRKEGYALKLFPRGRAKKVTA